jgi:hypothetical protein
LGFESNGNEWMGKQKRKHHDLAGLIQILKDQLVR